MLHFEILHLIGRQHHLRGNLVFFGGIEHIVD
jgi:hypothetical protein